LIEVPRRRRGQSIKRHKIRDQEVIGDGEQAIGLADAINILDVLDGTFPVLNADLALRLTVF
jgi:hypothetical protein